MEIYIAKVSVDIYFATSFLMLQLLLGKKKNAMHHSDSLFDKGGGTNDIQRYLPT